MIPIPALDSLRAAPARLFAAATFRVLGIPLRVESDSPRVLAAAAEAFGASAEDSVDDFASIELAAGGDGAALDSLRAADHPGAAAADGRGARVRIRVRPGGGAGPVRHDVPRRELLLLSGPGCSGYADTAACEAVAEVDEALLDDRDHFRAGVLEALALFLLARMDRDPLHASAVARGDSALLLAGRSGVGKSTLVYAAARAGLRVLSEDAVYLQSNPPRVWGMPRFVHLTPETARFFPELAEMTPKRLFNGKTKLAIDLRTLASDNTEPVATRAGICLLARGSRPGAEPIDPREGVAELTAALEPGFDAYADSVGEKIARIAETGAWRLTLPPHPADAVPLLGPLLDALESRAAVPIRRIG